MTTQLTTGNQLYAEILAHPAGDTLRLAFADHLDEVAGTETDHSALIRGMIAEVVYGGRFQVVGIYPVQTWWQCDRGPNGWPSGSPLRRGDLGSWSKIMGAVFGSPPFPPDDDARITFTRGFPGLVECPAA